MAPSSPLRLVEPVENPGDLYVEYGRYVAGLAYRLLGSLGEAKGFVPLLDSGDGPTGPYVVMPLLTGGTLRDRLAENNAAVAEDASLLLAYIGFQMRDKILETFKRVMPQVPAEIWSDFSAECDPRELEDAIVPLYLASFTAEELDAMLVFYHSPVGEKLLRKQPEIFRASSEAGRQWASDITFRLRARLTEKGYPPPGAPGS